MEANLNNHHRDTLRKLFEHPPSHNIEWREIESLLEAVGTVTKEANGKIVVSVGPEPRSCIHHTGRMSTGR